MDKPYVEVSSVDQHLWGLSEDRLGHTLNILVLVTMVCLHLPPFFQFYLEFLSRNLMWRLLEGATRFTIYLKAKI